MELIDNLLKDLESMKDEDIIDIAIRHSNDVFYAEKLIENFKPHINTPIEKTHL